MLTFPISNETFYCNLSTPAIDSNETTTTQCFGRGICIKSSFANSPICDCKPYYNPLNRCENTFFEAYGGYLLLYTIPGLFLYGIFLLLLASEIVIDLKFRIYKAPLYSKACLLLFVLLRLIHLSGWIYASIYGLQDSLPLVDTILRSLGVYLLGAAYLLVCIAWFDLLLTAKNLGDRSRLVGYLRIALLIGGAITIPIAFLCNIIANISTLPFSLREAVELLGTLLVGLYVLSCILVSVSLLIIVYRWLEGLPDDEKSSSKIIRRVLLKNRWLVAMNSMLMATLVMIFVFSRVPLSLPHITLLTEGISRLVELGSLIALYGFLQSYLLIVDIPCLGYYYGMVGNSAFRERMKHSKTSIKKAEMNSRKSHERSSPPNVSTV